ncbi:MAG: efflux RND transporter periplasmic adaptor subunit [Emcibacteraceae bacterium]|nr:efflux RND transporter periplasmic adaptor subunit [Emcibacteraceae bacterium]
MAGENTMRMRMKMKKINNVTLLILSGLIIAISSNIIPYANFNVALAQEEVHEEGEEEIILTAEQILSAGITTKTMMLDSIEKSLQTTGEVKANEYESVLITPRISSIVIDRHSRLGERVNKGQLLITLFSVEMASSQSKFINASQEWDRVKELGRDIVSAKRFVQAETDYREILARLMAYGMSNSDIDKLYKTSTLDKPGEYELYASKSGTISSDDFLIGAMVDAGTILFKIINEETVWIESPLPSSQFEDAFNATRAIIKIDEFVGEARVISAGETVDEATRRRNIRLIIENADHKLHPGQFVDVEFLSPGSNQGLIVPKDAVLRSSDGDWLLFVQDEDGGFLPREVEILNSSGDQYEVSGVVVGESIVITGAFFIQSELAKSGFSVHNH